jgi:23S rRNA (cytosine1962-C5)-methyltransferase
MFSPDQYQLLDFGDGRRLERFGPYVFDRPCPTAESIPREDPDTWQQADARFDRTEGDEGRWTCRRELPERWTISYGRFVLELKRTDFGHLGVFPEQAENWEWLMWGRLPICQTQTSNSSDDWQVGNLPHMRVLNLFAYTGGATLAAAAAGAEVVHVDSAKNTVVWARRNAGLSGLAEAPIRWIAEDAIKFVKRELRRGNRYDAVVLDPPSYGHGLHGEVWRLSKHLPRLLGLCAELTEGSRQFMLLTCHTPGFGPERLTEMMAGALGGADQGSITARQLTLRSATGRELPSGVVVQWEESDP